MKKLLILILFLIILFFSSNILAIDEISPNITIIFPENNSILNYTHIWLNWTADETLDWCVYSLNGAANDTSICLQTELNDSSIEKNLSYSSAGSQLVYIKIPKNSNVTSAYLNLSGFVKSYDDWSFSIDGESESPMGITFNGTYFWVIGIEYDSVWRYLADGTYDNWYFYVGDEDGLPMGVYSNGTYIWWVGINSGFVWRHLANGTYDGWRFFVSSVDSNPIDIYFDGTYFWILGFINKRIYRYTADGSYDNWYFDVGDEDDLPIGFTFNGTYFWVIGNANDRVYRYLANGTYDNWYFDVGNQIQYSIDVTFNGTYFWVISDQPDRVFRYIEPSYPFNPLIDTGNDGTTDWSLTGELNSTNSPQLVDLNITAINYWLSTCSENVNGTCSLPLNFTSDTAGILEISNINIKYQNSSIKFTASEGLNNITIYGNDTAGNMGQSNYVYFTVDTTPPNISDKFINETSPVFPNTIVCLNVSGVSDNFQLDEVWAEVTQSNGTIFNITMSDTGSCAGISEDGWYSADVNVGDSLGSFYYNASYVNDTAGNINANTTVQNLTLANIIDLSNLTVRYIHDTKRIFKFLITNNMNSRLDDISWTLDTGETVINSQRNISLGPNKTIFVNVFYNYINPGTYNVTATAYANGLSDSETIEVTI